jgi:hypothetical protein
MSFEWMMMMREAFVPDATPIAVVTPKHTAARWVQLLARWD